MKRLQITIILLGILATGSMLFADEPLVIKRSPDIKRTADFPVVETFNLKRPDEQIPTWPIQDETEERIAKLEAKIEELTSAKTESKVESPVEYRTETRTEWVQQCINGVCSIVPKEVTVQVPVNQSAVSSTIETVTWSEPVYSTMTTSSGCNCVNCQCNSLAANAHLLGDKRLAAKTRRRNLLNAWFSRPGLLGWRLRFAR